MSSFQHFVFVVKKHSTHTIREITNLVCPSRGNFPSSVFNLTNINSRFQRMRTCQWRDWKAIVDQIIRMFVIDFCSYVLSVLEGWQIHTDVPFILFLPCELRVWHTHGPSP